MANEISTAGIALKYAVESTAGTRPTTNYTQITNIKATPEFNSAPESIDVTDLSDTVWMRSIPGLRSAGDSLAFTANFTSAFKTLWEALVAAYTTAKASSKATWFEVMVPNFGSFYFAGVPEELGLPSSEVNNVFDGDVYITPNQIVGWAESSTVTP